MLICLTAAAFYRVVRLSRDHVGHRPRGFLNLALVGVEEIFRMTALSESSGCGGTPAAEGELLLVKPVKAYDDTVWIHSRGARHVRIMCEYLNVQDRLRDSQVYCTFLVFGSARSYSTAEWTVEMEKAEAKLALLHGRGKQNEENNKTNENAEPRNENKRSEGKNDDKKNDKKEQNHKNDKTNKNEGTNKNEQTNSTCYERLQEDMRVDENEEKILNRINELKKIQWMCEYYEKTYELSRLLAVWVQTPPARKAIKKILTEVPSPVGSHSDVYNAYDTADLENPARPEPVGICTGGGPGMMAAANKAAHDTPGARSIGMGISLPHEPGLNPYVDTQLAFEFHYFFTRKFWMLYSALCLIATPGGLGTMDELMEVLTLKQTKKFKRDIPVVLLGRNFWSTVINFDALVTFGVISEKDREQIFLTDSPQEAFEHIKNHILADRLLLSSTHIHKSKRLCNTSSAFY